MTMTPPRTTTQDRQAALLVAMRVRQQRAEAKKRLRAGEFTFAEFVETSDADPVLAGCKVVDLMAALNKRDLLALTLRALKIPPRKTLRGLGSKQRAALLRAAKEGDEENE